MAKTGLLQDSFYSVCVCVCVCVCFHLQSCVYNQLQKEEGGLNWLV